MGHRHIAAMTMPMQISDTVAFIIGTVLTYDVSRGSSRRGTVGGET